MLAHSLNLINYQNFTYQIERASHFLINKVSSIFNKTIESLADTYYWITMYPRGLIIQFAANNNASRLLNTFLTRHALILQDHRSIGIISAAKNNHLGMLQALLVDGDISQEHRGAAVTWAGKNNNLVMLQALLVDGDISQEHRGAAVTWAAKNNNLVMLQALLADANISQEHRGLAICNAAQNNNLVMFEALLVDANISQEHKGAAVTWAAYHGNLAMIQTLLANGPISEVYRLQAIGNAQVMGHFAIVAILGGNPNRGTLDVHSGDREMKTKNSIINFYTHQGPIPNSDLAIAYEAFSSYLNDTATTAIKDQDRQAAIKAKHALIGAKADGEGYGPFIDLEYPTTTVLNHEINTKEFIARLWIFANSLTDANEKAQAITGMRSALADSVQDNGDRVCNFGKIHRLIVCVLQGRFIGANLDDVEVQEISMSTAETLFFATEAAQSSTQKLSTVLIEANKFCQANPLVHKKHFLKHLADGEFIAVERDIPDADIDAFIDSL